MNHNKNNIDNTRVKSLEPTFEQRIEDLTELAQSLMKPNGDLDINSSLSVLEGLKFANLDYLSSLGFKGDDLEDKLKRYSVQIDFYYFAKDEFNAKSVFDVYKMISLAVFKEDKVRSLILNSHVNPILYRSVVQGYPKFKSILDKEISYFTKKDFLK